MLTNQLKISFQLASIIFFTIMLLAGCKTMEQIYTDDGYIELKGNEIRKILTESIADAGEWKDSFTADGKMAGTNIRGKSYSGSWHINRDGQLCVSSSNHYINGCSRLYQRPGERLVEWIEPDGRAYSVTIIPIKR